MANDSPTGSVSGRGTWEWNRRRDHEGETPERSRDGAATEGDERPPGTTHRRPQRSATTDEEDGEQDLEAALARKNRQLQMIRERYERILTERNRQLEEAMTAEDDREGGPLSDLLGRLRGR